MKPHHIAIVIPAKNEESNLSRVLAGLRKAIDNYGGKCEVFLVDNGSTDATPEIARSHGCKVIFDDGNTIAKLRNAGARHADCDVVGFLDADCIVDPGWLNLCMEKLSEAGIGIVGTRAVPDLARATWVEEGWYRLISGSPRPDYPKWLGTSNLLVRKEAFDGVGGFDEALETAEDVDFCRKVGRDFRLYLEKRIDTIHLRESNSIPSLFRRELWRGKNSLAQFIKSNDKKAEALSVITPVIYSISHIALLVAALLMSSHVFAILAFTLLLPLFMIFKKRPALDGVVSFLKVYAVAYFYLLARSLAVILEARDMLLKFGSNRCFSRS